MCKCPGVHKSYREGKVFEVLLHWGVTPSATNQSLCIKDGVLRVGGQLVLGSITNQTLPFPGEGHIGWGDAVSLVIRDDLHTAIFEHPDTAKRGNNLEIVNNMNKCNVDCALIESSNYRCYFLPRVGGAQVDSNHSSHTVLLVLLLGKHGADHHQHHHHPHRLHHYLIQVRYTKKSEKQHNTGEKVT